MRDYKLGVLRNLSLEQREALALTIATIKAMRRQFNDSNQTKRGVECQ